MSQSRPLVGYLERGVFGVGSDGRRISGHLWAFCRALPIGGLAPQTLVPDPWALASADRRGQPLRSTGA